MALVGFLDWGFGNLVRFAKHIAFRKEERGPLSWPFVGTLLLVLVYGLIMLFSASYVTAYYRFNDIYHFIGPQVVVAVIGLLVMFLISNINYRSLRYVYWHIYILLIGMLVLALFSEPQNNCHRWIYLFGNSLQPSEVAKFATVLGIALMTDQQYQKRHTLIRGLVIPLAPLLPIFVLLRLEPHNSAILLICMIAATMLFCGGCGLRWMPLMAVLGAGGIYLMLTAEGNSVANERLGAWGLLAESDVDLGYQTTRACTPSHRAD